MGPKDVFVIASNNKGKIKEFKPLLSPAEIIPQNEIVQLDVDETGTTFFEKESASYKYLDEIFVSSYKRKISNNFLLGYDLINMIININSYYGKYFQFGLRNEEKINTGLQSNPYYSEFNDNQNVKIYVVDNFKIIPTN